MKGPSSATQRKNKPINSGNGTTSIETTPLAVAVEDETASPVSGSLLLTNPPANVVVAHVHRRWCGTGPFDLHWLNLDCCGLFCAMLTYGLHIYGCWAVCCKLLPAWMVQLPVIDGDRKMSIAGKIHSFAFCSIALLAILSHLYAMTTDPGAVPPDAQPLEPSSAEETPITDPISGETLPTSPRRGKRICRRCNSFKPQRAHHCSICRRCIIKMDHHCPWVNNCVGIGNHKFFLLFLFYTFLSCTYSMTLLLVRFWVCMGKRRCLDTPTDLLPLIGLFVEGILFGLFTCCMMTDQWDVVSSNITHIDKLKGDYFFSTVTVNESPASGWFEVFGGRTEGFRLDWLAPFCKVHIPQSMRDDIMGFCNSCSRNDSDKYDKDEEVVELVPTVRTDGAETV